MQASASHLVLIPSYNTGPILVETVRAARAAWAPVWVVLDGSTDGSRERLAPLAVADPYLRLLELPANAGKGAAVLHGLRAAAAAGFTHALTMDASAAAPEAMILGVPAFDATAPKLRVRGRRVSNFWADLETLWIGIGDSLYGFRVYPIAPLVRIMAGTRWMRRFDFDPEAAVRLAWAGVRPVNLPAPVRYLRPEEGGVSHFRYLRDNALLTWMHLRLIAGFLRRLPRLLARRFARLPPI